MASAEGILLFILCVAVSLTRSSLWAFILATGHAEERDLSCSTELQKLCLSLCDTGRWAARSNCQTRYACFIDASWMWALVNVDVGSCEWDERERDIHFMFWHWNSLNLHRQWYGPIQLKPNQEMCKTARTGVQSFRCIPEFVHCWDCACSLHLVRYSAVLEQLQLQPCNDSEQSINVSQTHVYFLIANIVTLPELRCGGKILGSVAGDVQLQRSSRASGCQWQLATTTRLTPP